MTCIICELNPIHNGHKYLIDKACKNGPVVLIMSGNFTQRGSASLFDKYTRAKAAVVSGADLVLELPFPWCSAGAADFARAGVAVASAIGSERLMFGSGTGNGELLSRAGQSFANGDFDKVFANASKCDPAEGAAKLRERILAEQFTPEEVQSLSNPNDILGIEYYRYSYLEGGIYCIPVLRTMGENIASATALRHAIYNNEISTTIDYIPQEAMDILSGALPVKESALCDIARLLLRMDMCDIENSAECEGGLGYRLRRIAGECGDGNELLRLAATKKYTDARIRRALLYCTLKVTRSTVRQTPLYSTVLGIGKRGTGILRDIKKSGRIEILTKTADYHKLFDSAHRQFELSGAADRLYTMLMQGNVPEEYFLTVTPYVEK